MNTNKHLQILLYLFFCLSISGQTDIMTFNLRYSNPDDRENSWENRKEEVVSMLLYYQPGILGIQEGLFDQVNYLDRMLEDYFYVGVGRDDGKEKGEFSAIFFNTRKFEVLDSRTYWLSENPDSVSVGWDASMERIVTFGIFRNLETDDTLYVFNGHYDHVGVTAREKSSELIVSLIKQKGLEAKKVIMMGDLNSEPHSAPLKMLKTELKDAFDISAVKAYGPLGTFNGFDVAKVIEHRIDYILVRNLEVERYRNIDDRRRNNLFLSDHLPVLVTVKGIP